ncbi:MAG: hypothetical protein AAGC68_13435 [Verrucomicrobiota bacterium]
MMKSRFGILFLLLLSAHLLPDASAGQREPTPGRYGATLGDSGRLSFKVLRTKRLLSRVTLDYTFSYTDSQGFFSNPITASFRDGRRRRRIGPRGSFVFTFRNAEGGFAQVAGNLRGRKAYQISLDINAFQPVELFDPDTNEVRVIISNTPSGTVRTRARLVR